MGIIRISGEKARQVAAKVFTPVSENKNILTAKGYTAMLGRIHGGADIDLAVATVYAAPKSYTGEDVVELSCHGGVYILNKILQLVYQNGAQPAGAGEFTKRAFLNGKLSLTQAEAVMDIISAEGEQAARAALATHEGVLFKRINEIITELVICSSNIAAWIDFPEEDVPEVEENALKANLNAILSKLNVLLSGYNTTSIIKDGIDTVIAGRPNVGKSTLMNLLAGTTRSIVTDIAGTTRDVVEQRVSLGGAVLNLADTAGIRTTDDVIESMGVEIAKKRIETAQLVIAVFDSSQALTDDDKLLADSLGAVPAIAVINKTDLAPQLDTEYIKTKFKHIVELSAAKGEGLAELEKAVAHIFALNSFDPSAAAIANQRQYDCAEKAATLITEAIAALDLSLDAVCVNVDCAINSLMELTGERASEKVVEAVFERFCVGK